jgi:DnaK suppressor protein
MEHLPPDNAREALETERRRLLAEIDETSKPPESMSHDSQAAAASTVADQQRDLALRDRARHQLELVDAALERLEAGTFGTCQRCSGAIAPERLEALPWAAHCIACQREIGRRS